MNNRIKEVRKNANLTQTDFGKIIGVSQNYVWMIETGQREPSDRTIRDICREFKVSEEWLRNGSGEMYVEKTREEEMIIEVGRLMSQRPESFKAAVVSALLRFDPDGKEWEVLESIYQSIEKEAKKEE